MASASRRRARGSFPSHPTAYRTSQWTAISHRKLELVIWFELTTGARWEDGPPDLGCSGRTAHRRFREWEEGGIWDRLHAYLLGLLKRAGELDADAVAGDGIYVRFLAGEATGPSPVDRRKKGTKHTVMVDRHPQPPRTGRVTPHGRRGDNSVVTAAEL